MKTKQKQIEFLEKEINRLYPGAITCDLPRHEFDTGGLVAEMTSLLDYIDGAYTVVGNLNLWNVPASSLSDWLR